MKNQINRTMFIFISFIFSVIIGFRLLAGNLTLMVSSEVITTTLGITGIIYIYLFRILILPLTMISVIYGVQKIQQLKSDGPIGKNTLNMYMITTVFSIIIATLIVIIMKPGESLNPITQNFDYLSSDLSPNVYRFLVLMKETFMLKHLEGKSDVLVVLGVIIGLLISKVQSEKSIKIMNQLNDKVFIVAEWILLSAPIGVLSIMTVVFSRHGYDALIPLGKYLLTVIFIFAAQIIVVYQLLLYIVAKLNPLKFLRKIHFVLKIAFSTSSSNATLPFTMDMLVNNFGVSKFISQYTLPIGATVNMDGAAILYGSATVFLAQLYNVHLDLVTVIGIVIFSTITSVAASGVPSVGIFMLAIVLDYVGIPIEGLFFIIGVERILDMTSTLINVAGDAVCTLIIAKEENELDESLYNS